MKLSNALHLYRVRLRARLVGECFAVVGIAAGVALLFASQVSSQSLQSSVAELSRGIAGRATLQVLARGPNGFSQSMLVRVRHLPGVRVAAPLLEAGANASGPRGSESVELVGAEESLSELGGTLVRHVALEPFGGFGAVALPAPLARTIGVTRFGQRVTFQIAGHTVGAPLYEQLSGRQIGGLVSSPVALAPLYFAQELTGSQGRISRILVAAAPGRESQVRAALRRLAAGRLDVEGVGYDETLFAKAAAASDKSTELFAAISALVGFLFAFNAMLLTVPQRRRLIADLRRDGYAPRTVIGVLLLDGMVLGTIACVLGLALGDELSIHVLHSDPAFLSLAFAIGSQRVVTPQSVAIATGGGMLAAIVAVLSPLRAIFSGKEGPDRSRVTRAYGAGRFGDASGASVSLIGPRFGQPAFGRLRHPLGRDPLAAINPRQRRGRGDARAVGGAGRPAIAGVACLAMATAILLAAPDAAIPGMVLLVAALLLVLPFALGVTLALVERCARTITSAVPHIAAMELSAARARAVAIAATGAIAVFGSVAIQGAHGDLLSGLEGAARELNASTDVWVAPAGDYNLLDTTPFAPAERARLERLPHVRAVGLYRSGLLDYGQRRVLVIAPPRQANPLLPAGQIVQGNVVQATERVRAGGWLILSRALAAERHLRIGQAFTLPSPDPMTFRVAALSTNVGWAPGAIIMNATDYARAWGSRDASAYSIALAPGTLPNRAVHEIQAALAGGEQAPADGRGTPAGRRDTPAGGRDTQTGLAGQTGLAVQTTEQHTAQQIALSRQALARLTQIATLILIVAILAMAAAMGAMVWQRRPRLAKLKLEGLPRAALWRTILLESLILLAVGCLTGAIFGLYGQQLADRALASAVNFPVVYSVTALSALWSLTLVTATAVAILALPGYLAASVPAALALQD
jgi:putative ABC transport system permease protein